MTTNKREGHIAFKNPSSIIDFNVDTYRYYFKKHLSNNGLERFKGRTHICRRGCVTELYNKNWSSNEIMLITRHRSESTVRIYDRGGLQDIKNRIKAAYAHHNSYLGEKKHTSREDDINFSLCKLAEWMAAEKLILPQDVHSINALIMRFNKAQLNNGNIVQNSSNYYNWKDMANFWGISKTQVYQRIKYFEDEGIFHQCKDKNGEMRILIFEFQFFNFQYVELMKAAYSAGIYSRGKIGYLRDLAASGKIAYRTIGKLIYLERASFENWLVSRRKRNVGKSAANRSVSGRSAEC